MSSIPRCNANINGREVYSSGFSAVGNGIMGIFGTMIYGSLFLLLLFIYLFSQNIAVLIFCIIFFLLAIRNYYIIWSGGSGAPERPCINNTGVQLN